MTKSKNTKRALLASILSIIMCMAMLIGSTFAWFTDNVTSGKNKIVAGNLDIELNYKNAKMAADGEGFAEVLPTTENLFVNSEGNDICWEPGAAAVTYLELKNAGNLALKYQLSVDATDTVTGTDGAALSKVLKTAVVEITEAEVGTYDRATAVQKAKAADAESILGYNKPGEMTEQGQVKYLAMIVYFPEEIGNTYEGAVYNRSDVALEIELSLNLVATQMPYEKDSFGDQYDKDSEYLIVANTVDELNNAIGKLQAGDSVAIEMNDNIGLDAKINIPEGVTVALDMKNHKIGHETTEQIGVTPLVNSGNLTVRNAEIYSKDGMLNSTPAATATANAVLTSLAGNVVLEKCKLTNFSGRASGSYCVGISGGTVTLNDCIIDGYRGGISLGGDAVLKASKCTVNAQFYYPVYMYGQSTADFMNCTFNKCKVENPLNPNQAGNAGLIFDNRGNDAPIVKFDTCTFNSTWKDGQSVPLEVSGKLTGMIFTDCVFGDNITGLPN